MEGAVAGRVSGAGLGGLILGAVDEVHAPGAYAVAVKLLGRQKPQPHEVIEIAPSAGARIIRLPRPADLEPKTLSAAGAAAGVEEAFERVGLDYRATRPVLLKGSDANSAVLLPNGTGIAAEGGDAEVRIAPGVILEQGVRIVAPQGQRVEIGEGSRLLAHTQVVGNVQIDKGVVLDAVVTGNSSVGEGTQFTRGSHTLVHNSVLVPVVGLKPVPVSVNQAAAVRDSVVWGSPLYQGATVVNSIIGPYGSMGNHTMASRSFLLGASPDNRTAAAHHNDLISLFALPLMQRRDLSDPRERERLRDELLALRFGTVESRRAEVVTETGHASRPEERLGLRFAGRLVHLVVRALNLGALATTSNFDPRNDGSKGPTLLWGGVAGGVGAKFSAPVEVGPGALISNNATIGGLDALAPGTLVLPSAASAGAIKSGYLIDQRGRLGKGVKENVAVRLQVIHFLEVAASVAAAGAVRAAGAPTAQAGYFKEAKLLESFLSEAITDLERYLALVEVSERNLAAAPVQGEVKKRLEEQREILGRSSGLLASAKETAAVVSQRVSSIGQSVYPHRPADVVSFRNPSRVVELLPGTPVFSPDRVQEGVQKVRDGKALFVIFRAGRATRFADSVRKESSKYYEQARQRGRLDDQQNASKLSAPLGVSGLGPDLRQLAALAELGRQAGKPLDVVIVDSSGNRPMLSALMEADRASPTPSVAWEYLNLISESGSTEGLVDQGEGLEVTTLDGKPVLEWDPNTGRRDKPVKAPSGEYGAFIAGVWAAQTAGIDVTQRDIVPVYGDQAGLYTDPDFDAALLGNLGDQSVTAVAVQHLRAGDRWVPDGGVITEAEWPDGRSGLIIAERDVRNPALSSEGLYNPRLDEHELATAGFFPYNAGAPVFSARFVAQLLDAKVDLRKQSKTRQIRAGPGEAEVETVQVLVSELELTQLVQIASEQNEPVQVLRTELGRRQALKSFGDVAPATARIFEEGKARLQAQLGDRLEGNLSFIEVAPGATSFQTEGEGRLVVGEGVGLLVDRWGLWAYHLVGQESGIPMFEPQRRLILPVSGDNVIRLNQRIEVARSAAGAEETADFAADSKQRVDEEGKKLVVVSYEVASRHPELLRHIGKSFEQKGGWLILLPADRQGMDDLLAPFASELGPVTLWEFGNAGDASLEAFNSMASIMGFRTLRASAQEWNYGQLMRQIISILRSVPPSDVDNEWIDFFFVDPSALSA